MKAWRVSISAHSAFLLSFVFLTLAMLSPAVLHADAMLSLHKGVNTFPWLYGARSADDKGETYSLDQTFPNAGEFTREKLEALRKMGFDFVRIPVETSPFLSVPASQRQKLIAQVLAAADLAESAGLTTIIDLHPAENSPRWKAAAILASTENQALYRDVAVEFAATIVREGKKNIVLELMNEPQGGWGPGDPAPWPQAQKQLVKTVRHVAPELPLIATGDKGGGIDGLLKIDPASFDDPHILYSFHYYDPMVVTHQSASWSPSKWRQLFAGVSYPPAKQDEAAVLAHVKELLFAQISDRTEAQKEWSDAETNLRQYYENPLGAGQVKTDFARVDAWAKSHHIPASRIILGEFGIYRPGASREDAIHYLKAVRSATENAHYAWTVFNYEPNEYLPAFSLLQFPGPVPASFDSGIIVDGLGLRLDH